MTPNQSHVAGLELALDRWNDGGQAIQYRTLLSELIEQAKSTHAESTVSTVNPVQCEGVEVVGYLANDGNLLTTESGAVFGAKYRNGFYPLMTVAQHKWIVDALKEERDRLVDALEELSRCAPNDWVAITADNALAAYRKAP